MREPNFHHLTGHDHIAACTVCPVHKSSLTETCCACREEFRPLSRFSRPGHCARCGAWLGQKEIDIKAVSKQSLWTTTDLLRLIRLLQRQRKLPTQRRLFGLLSELAQRHFGAQTPIPMVIPGWFDDAIWRFVDPERRKGLRLKVVMEACRLHRISFAELMEGKINPGIFRPWVEWTKDEIRHMIVFRGQTEGECTPLFRT